MTAFAFSNQTMKIVIMLFSKLLKRYTIPMTQDALLTAITTVGGQRALARKLGVTQGQLWRWLNRDKKAPATRCIAIERATNGQITRYQLRPDVFGNPEDDARP
jgi:DNA-binding transcriptional regulator YdaS (Cro superfamily)